MADVTLYSTSSCPYCVAAKNLFKQLNADFEEVNLDRDPALRQKLSEENKGWRTVPMIFIKGQFIGGFDDVNALHKRGELAPMLGGQ